MPEKKPPSQKPLKSLKDEDVAVWDIATSDVKPIAQKTISTPHPAPKSPKPIKLGQTTGGVSPIIGVITLENAQKQSGKQNSSSSFQVDASLKKRFERGDLPIDGKIDLHGLTLEQAHRRFISFIAAKIAAGARFLLVVTGKGAGGEGVIRKNLPLWCDAPDLKPHILQRTQAKLQHGGSGATYILLRKKRDD